MHYRIWIHDYYSERSCSDTDVGPMLMFIVTLAHKLANPGIVYLFPEKLPEFMDFVQNELLFSPQFLGQINLTMSALGLNRADQRRVRQILFKGQYPLWKRLQSRQPTTLDLAAKIARRFRILLKEVNRVYKNQRPNLPEPEKLRIERIFQTVVGELTHPENQEGEVLRDFIADCRRTYPFLKGLETLILRWFKPKNGPSPQKTPPCAAFPPYPLDQQSELFAA